jgi:hypothetical protein
MATNPQATNSQWTPQDAPAQVDTVNHDIETKISTILSDLEGKTRAQLTNLYNEALKEESDAKQDLYMLRQRIASLGTDVESNEEVLLKSAKQRVATGIAYIKALELKLEGKSVPPTATSVTSPAPTTVQASQEPAPEAN